MRATCRRSGCWNAVMSWLSDWCNPACQFADLAESGVDMRMRLPDEPGGRFDDLRYATAAADYELVDDHRRKFRNALYVEAGGTVPVTPIHAGKTSSSSRPLSLAGAYVDEMCPPAPKPLPRTRRPLFAGLLRRLFP